MDMSANMGYGEREKGERTVQLVLGERERDVHGVVDRVWLDEGADLVDFLVVLGRAARIFFVSTPARLQPVVDREVIHLLQLERDAVDGEARPHSRCARGGGSDRRRT